MHPSLVFVDPLKDKTVGWEAAARRYERWGQVALPQPMMSCIRELYAERNRIQHFETHPIEGEQEKRLRHAVVFAMQFCFDQLKQDLRERWNDANWQALVGFTDFRQGYWDRVSHEGGDEHGWCPNCWGETAFHLPMTDDSDSWVCRVCGAASEGFHCEDCTEFIAEPPMDFFGLSLCDGCYNARMERFDRE